MTLLRNTERMGIDTALERAHTYLAQNDNERYQSCDKDL